MEQVKVEDAARELGLTAYCLRELLIRDKIPIGHAFQNGRRRKFVIFRGLLEEYKAKVKGGET